MGGRPLDDFAGIRQAMAKEAGAAGAGSHDTLVQNESAGGACARPSLPTRAGRWAPTIADVDLRGPRRRLAVLRGCDIPGDSMVRVIEQPAPPSPESGREMRRRTDQIDGRTRRTATRTWSRSYGFPMISNASAGPMNWFSASLFVVVKTTGIWRSPASDWNSRKRSQFSS